MSIEMVTDVVSIRNDAAGLKEQALSLVDAARELCVVDRESCNLASEKLLGVAALRREIEGHYGPMKQKAHEAHRAICEAEKEMLWPVQAAEYAYKAAIGSYEMAQKRLAEEKRLKEELEARRAAEEAREREIETAENDGADVEEIAAIIAAPLTPMPQVPMAPAVARTKGVSTAMAWKGRVKSVLLLAKAAAAGNPGALSLLQVNESALGNLARATRGTLRIDGVEFYEEPIVRSGGRKLY